MRKEPTMHKGGRVLPDPEPVTLRETLMDALCRHYDDSQDTEHLHRLLDKVLMPYIKPELERRDQEIAELRELVDDLRLVIEAKAQDNGKRITLEEAKAMVEERRVARTAISLVDEAVNP